MEAREVVANVRLERLDRPPVDEHAPAETVAAAAADVRVGKDLAQWPTRGVLAEEMCTQPRLTERTAPEEEVGVAAETAASPCEHRGPMLSGRYEGSAPDTCAKTLTTICQRSSNFTSERKLVNDAVPQQPSSSTVACATSPACSIDMMCAV